MFIIIPMSHTISHIENGIEGTSNPRVAEQAAVV
jgi:hypothetical protein